MNIEQIGRRMIVTDVSRPGLIVLCGWPVTAIRGVVRVARAWRGFVKWVEGA